MGHESTGAITVDGSELLEQEAERGDCLSRSTSAEEDLTWPRKHDLFAVRVSATRYQEVADCVIEAARRRQSAVIDFMPVHGLISALRDPTLRARINRFDIVAPDGQPVRWALNRFHRARLRDRVYGPEMTLRLAARAADAGIPIYLYGSTPDVLQRLERNLTRRFPELIVAGAESPPFRPLTDEEDAAVVERINHSGAGLVFLGLGCPRQEIFAFDHRDRLHAVQLCVGAAFDFHAGTKRMAPRWMQQRGLEWLYRLVTEPTRLWRRYLVTNSIFSLLCLRRLLLGQ